MLHTKARIEYIDTSAMKAELKAGKIIVVAGFQGVTETGEVSTLGRGGSDLSAVAIAGALEADLCEIYTDVDGVYTTDPRIETKAKNWIKLVMMRCWSLRAWVQKYFKVALLRWQKNSMSILSHAVALTNTKEHLLQRKTRLWNNH